jgi:hypothetical protein
VKLKLILPVSCLLVILASSVHAQEQPEFKMPCPEVLKLGLDKFMDAYGEKTQDYSTYGQKQAFSFYVDCKRPANDQHAQQLTEARRKQAAVIRDALTAIGDASWSNAYLDAGGGTMYGLASVGAYAVREDSMGPIIAALVSETKQPASRRRANRSLIRARRLLPGLAAPDLEHWDVSSRPDHLKHYRENVLKIRNSFQLLASVIRLLPDRAAELTALRLEAELDASVGE